MESRKDQELERVQQPDNAHLVNGTVSNEVLAHISFYLPEPRDQASAAQACVHLLSIFQQPRNESAYKILAQAVIDDDRATMKKLLGGNHSFKGHRNRKSIDVATILPNRKYTHDSSQAKAN